MHKKSRTWFWNPETDVAGFINGSIEISARIAGNGISIRHGEFLEDICAVNARADVVYLNSFRVHLETNK